MQQPLTGSGCGTGMEGSVSLGNVFFISTPLPLLHPPPHCRCPPLHSPSPGRPCLLWLRRTLPPPCPPPRTSERRHAWRTSGRTCGPDGPRPRRWRWCCSACTRLSGPWPGLPRAPRWAAGS
uniref:Uncharacterized protein n=1 Tax=Anguilla anguilla TaxID=7936 RepID=A0A0E9XE58_ANGAN